LPWMQQVIPPHKPALESKASLLLIPPAAVRRCMSSCPFSWEAFPWLWQRWLLFWNRLLRIWKLPQPNKPWWKWAPWRCHI
jgi:hypothetical protein